MKHIHLECLEKCKESAPYCTCCNGHYHIVCWTIGGKRVVQYPVVHRRVVQMYALCTLTVFTCMALSMFHTVAIVGYTIFNGRQSEATRAIIPQCMCYCMVCVNYLVILQLCEDSPRRLALIGLHVVGVMGIVSQLPLLSN
jgi:hypothetical protein